MAEKRELSDTEYHNTKRVRTNDGGFEGSPGNSKVLHVRNISPDNSHEELVAFVSQFGSVVAICFLPKYQQALVEMETTGAATAVVMYSKNTQVYIRGKEVHFEYSKSQTIKQNQAQKPTSNNPNSIHHVLLCTILNPIYNITVDVIHAIMSPYGNVLRIVVFNKNGVQSFIEFENAYSAVQAYTALDGKDIYAGSCTLKIEFSKSEKLNVHVNNDKSWDYTNNNLPTGPSSSQQPGGASGYPPYGGYANSANNFSAYPQNPSGAIAMGQGPVLILYGIADRLFNVDRLFNIFSLFGNVIKIKLLPQKKNSALIHMEAPINAERAQNSMSGVNVFGQQLQVHSSKHPYIAESRADVEQAASGNTQLVKDFSTAILNRFRTSAPTSSKHIYRPSATLYFANAPREYTSEDFAQFFSSIEAPVPKDSKFFVPAEKSGNEERRSGVGLLEWPDVQSAVEALAIANNHKIGNNTLRLSFTANSINNERRGGGGAGATSPAAAATTAEAHEANGEQARLAAGVGN